MMVLPKRFPDLPTSGLQSKYEMLFKLIKEKALRHGDFKLSSGQYSNYYFDIKSVLCDEYYLDMVVQLIGHELLVWQSHIHPESAVSTCGLEISAIPIMAGIALTIGWNYIIVRKEMKTHGLRTEMIEPIRNMYEYPTVIIDDVISTGASLNRVASVVGLDNIKGVICVINRCPQGDVINMTDKKTGRSKPIDIRALYYGSWFLEE